MILAFFENLLEDHNLIDIPSAKPTWRNNRTGEASLARRLDRFLIKEPLVNRGTRIRQWVRSRGLSDHRPIYLEMQDAIDKPKAPFKFNSTWPRDADYMRMVVDYWKAHPPGAGGNIVDDFVHNLKESKSLSKAWAHRKRKLEDHLLRPTEEEIYTFKENIEEIISSLEQKDKITSLMHKRTQILKDREESWRLRSWEIWLKDGDNNTKFYHKFANERKVINTIWELKNEHGQVIQTFRELAALANSHFKDIYKAPPIVAQAEVMRIAHLFPIFVDLELDLELTREVTLDELEGTLKWLKKDKILGSDGWIVEFCIVFFDIIGTNLLRIIEDCRRRRRMSEGLNSTFIALISKADKPSIFDDFRPISLCNCIYKINAKIIANRLRPILSLHIYPEQFSFLQKRQIHEAVGIAQELLHTVQLKKLKGLNRLIGEDHKQGRIAGIKITDTCILTHLLFVDDVLIFLNGGIGDLTSLHNAFGIFQKATRMVLNEEKSTITTTRCSQHEIYYALRRFSFTPIPLQEGLRYLGYQLKPHGADWTWLITKVEKRLNVSYHKYLSRAGRLILIKVVLEAMPVYWMTLA
eukprot:PITA_30029